MPSHPDRVRRNYDECFHRGNHGLLIIVSDSDKAPFINADGTRTTITYCYDCGERFIHTRTQAEFEKELSEYFSKYVSIFKI